METHRPLELAIGRGAAGALDAAGRYLRDQLAAALPLYVLAIAPLAVAMLWVIDAVAARDRDALTVGCVLVTAAILWRWAWLAVLQHRVQATMRGGASARVARRLPAIVMTRLVAALALTWGALLLLPPYWGFFLAGFAGPSLLETEDVGSARRQVSQTLGWITRAVGPLARAAAMLAGFCLLLVGSAISFQYVAIGMILPALTGIDPTQARLTMSGLAWWLSLAFMIFCVFDLYWHIAAVMLFYHLAGRRLGTDLQARLTTLEEGRAAT